MGEYKSWPGDSFNRPRSESADTFDEAPSKVAPAVTPERDLAASSERSEVESPSAKETVSKPKRRRESSPATTTDQFTGALQPLQVKLPQDLIQSLKLHSIQTGRTMSELVLEYLTTGEVLSKAWVATRQAG